jgi:hypothetical protein
MLSTEHDLSSTLYQYQWLANNLRSLNRNRTPWVIIEIPLAMDFFKVFATIEDPRTQQLEQPVQSFPMPHCISETGQKQAL